MLIRRLARPMLAAIYIESGVQSLRDVEGHAKTTRPFLDKTIGKVRDSLPPEVPTDAETLIRIDSSIKISAGILLALGKCPRLAAAALAGSTVPTTLSHHAFWEYDDPDERELHRVHFMKNLGLLGGLLFAAVDTKGKPSLRYRAQHSAQRTSKAVHKAAR